MDYKEIYIETHCVEIKNLLQLRFFFLIHKRIHLCLMLYKTLITLEIQLSLFCKLKNIVPWKNLY